MKEMLEKMLVARQAKLQELQERSQASEDVNEVRSIGAEIDTVNAEIRDINSQLEALDKPAPVNTDTEERGFNPMATYGLNQGQTRSNDEFVGTTDSVEYRTAFMNMVLRKEPISKEVRANANTKTTDVGTVIPTQLVNRIIERMDQCGMILPLVTRTSYAGGVTIPTSNVKPVATWVGEGDTSDKQKKTTGSITFAYHKLRCEISMSMEVGTMALSAFEAKFVENVANAMVIAIEKSILAGDGSTQPKGILEETPANTLEIAAATPTYAELVEFEGKVPAEFEGTAKWFMTKAQFMKFVAMVDSNGQPIARVNYGINGQPERSLLGREVIIHPYATEMGDNVAAIFNFADYVLNTIYDMGISNKQDWDTEDLLTKAVMSVDGKVVDTGSLLTMTVAA